LNHLSSRYSPHGCTHGPRRTNSPLHRPFPLCSAVQGQKCLFTTPLGTVAPHSVQKGRRVKKDWRQGIQCERSFIRVQKLKTYRKHGSGVGTCSPTSPCDPAPAARWPGVHLFFLFFFSNFLLLNFSLCNLFLKILFTTFFFQNYIFFTLSRIFGFVNFL